MGSANCRPLFLQFYYILRLFGCQVGILSGIYSVIRGGSGTRWFHLNLSFQIACCVRVQVGMLNSLISHSTAAGRVPWIKQLPMRQVCHQFHAVLLDIRHSSAYGRFVEELGVFRLDLLRRRQK